MFTVDGLPQYQIKGLVLKYIFPYQILGIGKALYWFLMLDRINNTNLYSVPEWKQSRQKMTNDFELKNIDNFSIKVFPTMEYNQLLS